MRFHAFNGAVALHPGGHRCALTRILFALLALTLLTAAPLAQAQDSKSPAVLPAPAPGKAIVCIYRVGRFTGSASHDELYINDTHLAKLLNGEYAFLEVAPGTVAIYGLPKMYYGGIIQSTGAAINQAHQKDHERARFEAEAGKTYYFKWTAGAMGSGIKVTPMDPGQGAKEMSKLHLSKPVDEKDAAKPESKESEPAPAK